MSDIRLSVMLWNKASEIDCIICNQSLLLPCKNTIDGKIKQYYHLERYKDAAEQLKKELDELLISYETNKMNQEHAQTRAFPHDIERE
jgi:hypothetical protein